MRVRRDHFKHAADIGETHVVSLQHGRFYLALERFTGVYGQRHTVTYGLKWSASW